MLKIKEEKGRIYVTSFEGAVAKWSRALLERGKINEIHNIPGLPPALSTLKNGTLNKYKEF